MEDEKKRFFIAMEKCRTGFRPFSPWNRGAVCSLYDSAGKARRYSGKDGRVVYFDIEDLPELHDDPQRAYEEAERLSVLWAERAAELKKKVSGA